MNTTIEDIKKRRSVRSYSDKPITQDILKELVDCARLAPTARNLQPWEFVVVNERQLLDRLADIATYGHFLKQAQAAIIVLGRDDSRYFLEDGSAATENILVAAQSLGIGSCWIAGFGKEYAADVLNLLEVPEGYELVSILSLGYNESEAAPKNKRPVDEVLHWNKF